MESTKNTNNDLQAFTAIFMTLPAEKKTAVLHYMNGMAAQEAIDREKEKEDKKTCASF